MKLRFRYHFFWHPLNTMKSRFRCYIFFTTQWNHDSIELKKYNGITISLYYFLKNVKK